MARDVRFLLLTQDPRLTSTCATALQERAADLVEVREAQPLAALLDRGADLVLVDLNLPDRTLAAVADELAARREVPTVVLASGSREAWDRISRGSPLEQVVAVPFDAAQLTAAVDGLLERSRFLHDRLVGKSEAMQQIREQVLLIGPTPVTVLITGESGSGKDVVAEALHHYSGRGDRPYRPINCAAIPENLLENELFGHERGAFTDARAQARGLFEQADSGTVFLDEIGEMTRSAQVRLLRVLEERRVTRIGGDASIAVDVRVLAATNKDLLSAVAHGEFRRDLYYRLKVVEIAMPPLRARREDIPLLVDHWVEALTRDHRSARFEGFSRAAMDLLLEYAWPGNVRELRNLVEHLVFLGPPRGRVGTEDVLPLLQAAPSAARHLPVPTHKTPDQSERELIYFALLDLKREVAELRAAILDRGAEGARPVPRPVYQVDEEGADVAVATAVDGTAGNGADGRVPSLRELEREAIERALERVNHNRRKAAEMLGIGERTLYRKLVEYGLR